MLELDGAHGSFVQEEVLVSGRREQDTFGVQAAALQKGGMDVQGEGTEGTRRTHREPNTAELVEPCCRGLEERLARKGWLSDVRGRGGKVEARPRADGHEDVFLCCLHTFMAAYS